LDVTRTLWLAAALAASVALGRPELASAQSQCNLGNGIKHVVYIQFDNVHFRRDNPNVPSDIEQIPNLLNFLEHNGTVLTNHWTPLISHTSVDITTSLTGVYGDKFGFSIGNSFGLFQNGVAGFHSSFTYWTDVLPDGKYQMLAANGKNAPAPWVPFTRAGCDVGAFSIANIEFENITSDIDNVFGSNSPQAAEAKFNPTKAVADFEGILVHCAKGSALCTQNSAPDILKDEPGGYNGFNALYGNVNVQPQISPKGAVTDLDGNVVADSHGNPGFPGFDPSPSQTLGYLATMLEAGVPVVYGYIEDAHDNQGPALSGVATSVEETFGPGEAGYVTQLAAFNKAFGEFFARLAKDGITQSNTLFVITADENDHFVGGPPAPANCDGVTRPCTYAKKGEIDADLSPIFNTEFGYTTPLFLVHSDDAATFYIDGNPAQNNSVTRKLEHDSGALLGFDIADGPNGTTNNVTEALADQTEQSLLHMVTADPNRTPNFILFANPDYFLTASTHTTPLCTPPLNAASCFVEEPGFAWNHGDFQSQITNTWLGIAGPGVQNLGPTGTFFSDHTDIRPTLMSLTGLTDDYAHDGRSLIEVMTDAALPPSLVGHRASFARLAGAYKAINAPLGAVGVKSLQDATAAIEGGDGAYLGFQAQLTAFTHERDAVALHMSQMMEASEFGAVPFNDIAAQVELTLGQSLLQQVP
jgi:hypothetical protein